MCIFHPKCINLRQKKALQKCFLLFRQLKWVSSKFPYFWLLSDLLELPDIGVRSQARLLPLVTRSPATRLVLTGEGGGDDDGDGDSDGDRDGDQDGDRDGDSDGNRDGDYDSDGDSDSGCDRDCYRDCEGHLH